MNKSPSGLFLSPEKLKLYTSPTGTVKIPAVVFIASPIFSRSTSKEMTMLEAKYVE